ncbi:glucose dehydrogenase [FAD, quinone]-like [Anoplophora glabripennis]|uniref:glucose dehydrogenase [FAD, quinone]-like n=1 Tax=Anoplophora glabripennis TaxID=217634 RepID=UPI000C7954D3|nr:glucose dehydrogenase [FAD, quinone]-like [Anoplophora glabripennis]
MSKHFLIVLSFVNFIICCSSVTEEIIDHYEKVILEEKEKARSYELPSNAHMYIPEYNDPPLDFGTFDFIIAGAGSTGSVIARRLSEIKQWNILVLEAGEFGNEVTDIPRISYDVVMASDYNWGYYSVPQKNSCLGMEEERCPFPRGRGVGRTSLLNGLAYARGSKIDYDIWCAQGNPGWCYEDVLPYFKKSEDFRKNDPDAVVDMAFHGVGGPLHVNFPMPRAEQCKVFFKANEELGYQQIEWNGLNATGVSPNQVNVKHGKRQDSGTAFLKPVLDRSNLVVLTKSVMKIVINELKVAEGVTFSYKGRVYTAIASKEVIVSLGAISSPQLLMVSGIVPGEHLKEFGIPLVQNLEVGSALSDHVQIYGLTFSSNLSEPVQTLREQIKDYLAGVGLLSQPLNRQVLGYYQTYVEMIPNYQDLEISFYFSNATTFTLNKLQRWKESVSEAIEGVDSSSSFSMYPTLLHLKSTGTLRLKSASPFDYPLIDPKCLSDPEGKDLETAYQAVQLVQRLIDTEAFRKINAKLETKPIKVCSDKFKFKSKDYWYCALSYMSGHSNHPVGTCRMGPDPSQRDVVDAQLRVYGIGKLRVADASVIPLSKSSHPNAVCYMIAEKLADLLKIEYGML